MESITRVGIDVASQWLDVLIDRPRAKRRRYKNDSEGIGQLSSDLGVTPCLIAMESSGRYEALARHALEEAGHTVRVKNPRKVRRLADGIGPQAKTDAIDARFLAETAHLGRCGAARSKEREALGDLSRMIEALKKERSRHLKRIKVPGYSQIAIASLREIVKAIDAQLKKLEQHFVKLVGGSRFGELYRLAQTVPGVGPVLARILVCELPEDLDNWSIRELSAYAGVAPIDKSSGKRSPNAKVPGHGNSHLKGGLYMPAIAVVASTAWAARLYRRLRAKGRTHQQAATAVMHKLLIHVVCVLKRGSPWQSEPPHPA